MTLNRRTFISNGLVLTAAAGAISLNGYNPQPQVSLLPGIAGARAADVNKEELHKAPELGDRVLGPKQAPVTVVEYASATCPHCANFHKDTFPALKKEYIDTGKIRFIFREFPFDDLALAAFMLARCAPEDKYFPMLDVLFEKQHVWARKNPREELLKISKLAGFTEESFDKCLKNEKIAKGIYTIRETAAKKFGVNSTPTFFINGKLLSGNQPFEKFKEVIEAEKG